MNKLWRLFGSRSSPGPPASQPPETNADVQDPRETFIREAFWIVLGRALEESELRDQMRTMDAGGAFDEVALRLLSSPEFRIIHTAWQQKTITGRDEPTQERGLRALGGDERFVVRVHELLLGRPPEPALVSRLARQLADGRSRIDLVRGVVLSGEFADRYKTLSPEGGFLPKDVQLCELANPAKWDNPDWMRLLASLQVLSPHKLSMHRKTYEFTQLLYGLDRLRRLGDEVSVLSVGAGHECVLYWLANHAGRVVATDMYSGRWQNEGAREGNAEVVHRARDFAPFPYRDDRLIFLKMDGRRLALADETFDVAYSLSSIEHFGGFPAACEAIEEMARVLKPGGLLVLATEYILSGPDHYEAFRPDEVRALTRRAGLRLVQPIDESVYTRYEYVPVDVEKNPFQTPHMVVRIGDTIFTSVMAFLEKPGSR
jgi:ubiquinone/menaquinone biosynthesis C-methylase UbiE